MTIRVPALWPVLLLALVARPGYACRKAIQTQTHAQPRTAILDRIVAVVDGHPILTSDVDDEMRFAALQSSPQSATNDAPQQALNRVIDRTLINQQRALQPGVGEISAKDVGQAIASLRSGTPACAKDNCKTADGWSDVLAAHGLTPLEVEDRVRERLAILKFIDLRFGVAVRVSNAAIQKYYDQVLQPELKKNHATVPEMSAVAPRIREILRQQQIDSIVDQWVKSLHSEGQVRILDSAFKDASHSAGENGQ